MSSFIHHSPRAWNRYSRRATILNAASSAQLAHWQAYCDSIAYHAALALCAFIGLASLAMLAIGLCTQQ